MAGQSATRGHPQFQYIALLCFGVFHGCLMQLSWRISQPCLCHDSTTGNDQTESELCSCRECMKEAEAAA